MSGVVKLRLGELWHLLTHIHNFRHLSVSHITSHHRPFIDTGITDVPSQKHSSDRHEPAVSVPNAFTE